MINVIQMDNLTRLLGMKGIDRKPSVRVKSYMDFMKVYFKVFSYGLGIWSKWE